MVISSRHGEGIVVHGSASRLVCEENQAARVRGVVGTTATGAGACSGRGVFDALWVEFNTGSGDERGTDVMLAVFFGSVSGLQVCGGGMEGRAEDIEGRRGGASCGEGRSGEGSEGVDGG